VYLHIELFFSDVHVALGVLISLQFIIGLVLDLHSALLPPTNVVDGGHLGPVLDLHSALLPPTNVVDGGHIGPVLDLQNELEPIP
jgi:hypothetical protein